jgi:cytochrome c biogenesis protein CcmG/thiol:disulfide interchange protein DsbE
MLTEQTEQTEQTAAKRAARSLAGASPAQKRGMVMLLISAVALLGLIALLIVRLVTASQAASVAPTFSLDGKPAPDFTATVAGGPQGQTFHLAAERGKPVVINFFASWCDPCVEEAPILKAGYATYAQQDGVIFIGIVYQDSSQNALAFARQYGEPYAIGEDPKGLTAIAYGVTGIPETVFINRAGTVVSKYGGPLDSGSLARSIQSILK